jgi:hypothetical protein
LGTAEEEGFAAQFAALRSIPSSSHGEGGELLSRLGLRFAEDFEQHRPDTEVALAIRAAARALLGRMSDQVFQLFAQDIIFIRGIWNPGQIQWGLPCHSIHFSVWDHRSTSIPLR